MKNCKKLFMLGLALFMCLALFKEAATVEARGVSLNKTTVTTVLAKKAVRLKVEGPVGKRKVKWYSSKKKVATVDQKGLVTLKSKGNAVITARVGRKKLRCIVSVVSKKAYAAVQVAKKYYRARNMHYSQGRRMSRRYADCSSFCGRCYLAQGMTLGGSRSWCNTAAGMAQWTSSHHRVVSNGKPAISSKTLLPGDLVFYRGGYNGRYKNIYHVEIFTGYEWDGDSLAGNTMSSIRGNYPSILKRDYSSRRGRIAQVSRPAR